MKIDPMKVDVRARIEGSPDPWDVLALLAQVAEKATTWFERDVWEQMKAMSSDGTFVGHVHQPSPHQNTWSTSGPMSILDLTSMLERYDKPKPKPWFPIYFDYGLKHFPWIMTHDRILKQIVNMP